MWRRGADLDCDDDMPFTHGSADALLYPDDLTLQNEADLEAWKEEIAAKRAKRIRPGFYVGIEKLEP